MDDSDDEDRGIARRESKHADEETPQLPPREYEPAKRDVSELGALADLEKLTVVSYNILSQLGARRLQRDDMGYVDPSLLSIMQRRERLLREILSYDSDVLCLQEVDDYDDFWSWQLTRAGYDSVFAIHPRKSNRVDGSLLDDGLVIAFRREVFQVFKTETIDLNDILDEISDDNLIAKADQNCIALCVQLQPWEQSKLPSAVCVVCTQLAAGGDSKAMELVRVLQTEYLCRRIAQINAVAQLPIILAGTFNSLPSSDVYHVIHTGRRRPRPRPPSEIDRPKGVDVTPTSITLGWDPPECGDARILGYKIAIKNCTSATLGFGMHEIEVEGGSEVTTHPITTLSSGITYQFRIAARNQYGYGPFSQPSLPITTMTSAKLQASNESKDTDDNHESLYIANDIPPLIKPYATSFGSGRTPRYESRVHNAQVSPRKLAVPEDKNQSRYTTLEPRADRDPDLVHGEQYQSAYATYQGYLSEPEFTYASPHCIGTIDYIFYSASQFEPFQLLGMPTLDELNDIGVDIRQAPTIIDKEWAKHKPELWQDVIGKVKNDEDTYMGEWVAPTAANTFVRQNPWLPNRVYPSDHVALACVLAVKKDNLAVQWN